MYVCYYFSNFYFDIFGMIEHNHVNSCEVIMKYINKHFKPQIPNLTLTVGTFSIIYVSCVSKFM